MCDNELTTMSWTNKARIACCLFVIALLGNNAIGAGVCVKLCSARVCCPAVQTKTVSVRHCDQCPDSEPAQPAVKDSKKHPKSCCDWITKKTDPPATLLADLSFADSAPIQSTFQISGEVAAQPRRNVSVMAQQDRAPPSTSLDSSSPRAPPIVRM